MISIWGGQCNGWLFGFLDPKSAYPRCLVVVWPMRLQIKNRKHSLFISVATWALCSTAHAGSVQTIEVPRVEGLVEGGYVRVIASFETNGKQIERTIIENTRVQIRPAPAFGKIRLRLPCVSGTEMLKLANAQQLGSMLRAEPLVKGSASHPQDPSISDLMVDSRGVTPGWCTALTEPDQGENN